MRYGILIVACFVVAAVSEGSTMNTLEARRVAPPAGPAVKKFTNGWEGCCSARGCDPKCLQRFKVKKR